MQSALRRHTESLRTTQGVSVQIRVGLHSGEVVVRAVGSDLRMDYSAVGQTTHLAARMEQLATPGTTLVTGVTLGLADGYVEVRPLGPVPVKGVAAPVETYELVGAGPLRSRLGAAAARGLTQFVGRTHELEQLREALGRAAAGHGQAIALVGEPGVGKSRLIWEITHSHRIHGWLVLHAGAHSYRQATPYGPVIDLLRGHCRIEDGAPPWVVREQVTGKILALDRALEESLPALISLLGVSVGDSQWNGLDPVHRRRATRDALTGLLVRESQVQPVLLALEDLHWIDAETQTFLDELVEALPARRLLLLVNYRPEYEHCRSGKTSYAQLRLDVFSPEGARALLENLLGPDATLLPLKLALIERTKGNPFFLEESVRTLVETRAVTGSRGAYHPGASAPTVVVPATVQAMLAARIDRLAEDDKALLQTASVVGQDVPLSLLRAIAGLDNAELNRGLARLQATEFLYETHSVPERAYTFTHALTHDVAYGSLLHDRRRRLHTAIVDALERLHPDPQTLEVDRLAHHAIRGEAWDRAVVYAHRAGEQAVARSANQEAASWFEHAIGALRRLADSQERREAAVDIRLALRTALVLLRGQGAVVDLLAETQALAEALGDRRRLGWVVGNRVTNLMASGDAAGAFALGERVLELADQLEDLELQSFARAVVGTICVFAGNLRRAVSLFRWNIETLGSSLAPDRFNSALPSAYPRAWAARSLAELGEFTEARVLATESVRLAETSDHPFSLIVGWWAAGWVDLIRGAFPDAIRALEHGLALSRRWSGVLYVSTLSSGLALAYAVAGRREDADALLSELRHAVEGKEELLAAQPQAWLALASVHLEAGRLDAACETARTALDKFRVSGGVRPVEGHLLHVLGEVAVRRDPPEFAEAERRFAEARALADQLEMRPLVAHCHLALGDLCRRTGDQAKAKEHLRIASTMYAEMDMRFWLERSEAARGRLTP
jgi:tetratricopeptide (TPR) repeat protein